MDPCGEEGVRTVRPGVRLGVDVGDVRIGVARCDPSARIATPVETVPQGPGSISRLLDLAAENAAVEVVVGLPRSLSGRLGPAAVKVTAFANALRRQAEERGMSVPVRLVDERLTTVSAERQLRERGRKGARRRAVVDQAAAVVILQHAIDTERSTGRPPGEEVGHPT
jgi:putative Holliday junction resolvase